MVDFYLYFWISVNQIMKPTFAQRLKSIRLRKGWSLEELANRMGNKVSKQAISKYEQAKMLPDELVLHALTEVFEVKPEYFFHPLPFRLESIKLRTGHALGKKEALALKAEIISFIEPYLELENLMGIDSTFVNPLQQVSIHGPNDIEEAVIQLRNDWNLGLQPIHNLLELLEHKNIKVHTCDHSGLPFDGLLSWINHEIPIISIHKDFNSLKRRIIALRELAYLLIPESLNTPEISSYFANAFLIPKPVFIEEVGQRRKSLSIQELIKLKEQYGIPIQNIIERAATFGIIPLSIHNRFKRFLKSKGGVLPPPKYGRFDHEEKPGRFDQLLHKAIAEEIIPLEKAADLANTLPEQLKENIQLL